MKISHAWLQEYFKKPLPDPEKLSDLITFHTFEVEGIEKSENGPIIDISVLPNRSHDCLSYEGMAREIGILLGQRVVPHTLKKFPKGNTRKLSITIEEEKLCPRYTGMLVENIQVGPSPARIKKHLESIGQRSINNVVDIMNFVMFETGQPLHAFDADKLVSQSNSAHIIVRKAKPDEKITTLDNKDVELNENVLVIADDENVLAIAGIKGGKRAEVTGDTKNIIIESANFSGSNIRKTSKDIGIRTDASIRFEHGITPEKTKDAITYVASLLAEFATGLDFVAGKIKDVYPRPMSPWKVGVSLTEINKVLGTAFIDTKVTNILKKFHFEFTSVIPHDEIVRLAPSFVGVPYVRGASVSFDAPKAFDCSSFVTYLYAQAGVALPRISVDLYTFAQKISKEELLPGDIIFLNSQTGNIFYETVEFMKGTKVPVGIDHCGIYLGEGKIIHCSESKGGVVVEEIDADPKFQNIVGYGRVAIPGESRFVVTAPSERLDLRIKEDLIEEIGRIYGYEKVVASKPVMEGFAPAVNKNFYYTDKIRAILSGLGFSEIST
ncbi:MAG: phenylalanine--tRNA ligase beta subunit-related protein, partial [Candidatus Parcubacteria bacterium]|nr:phenylalanine--tRNA ligase beta subunit-related protein [Candidatus Parcubacteria bacterium]